jgi:tetratricopeptide (TPR) repeat protein
MVIGEAAEALAQSGFGAEGLKLVEAVDDGPRREADRGRVRFLLAITLARVGKLAEARAVADGVQDELAHVQILIGRTHKSLTWLPPPEEDGLALLRLKAGDRNEAVRLVDQAAELAGRIQDRGHKEAALAHVALGRVRLSDLPEALRLAADLGDAAWAAKVWTAVARAQAAAGLDAEARRMIDHIKPPGLHAHAQIHLALGQKEGGRRDAARITFQEAARQIDGLPEGERAIHLHNLMSARGEVGDVDAALAGVGSGDRSVALANVVHAQVKAGDLAGAWQTAEKLAPGSWWRGNVVRLIAQAEVRRDGLERVLAKQRTWQSDLDRACFLTGAAEGLLPRPPGAMD